MKDSLNTLKELASSVRNATKEGENSAERIGRLFEGILEYIKTPESIENYFELKQDSNGLDYIYTKYNIASAGALSMYASDKINVPSIYDGLPIDNDTIYWHEVDGSKVLKAKGGGGEAGSVQWDNISGKPSWIEDTKPSYSWSDITGEKPFYTKEEIASKYVTIDTEQEITALKHFTAGLSVGESKKKIYEENGVVYIDADVAVTGAMTFYASAGRSVSTIMDGVTVDEETITKGSDNVLRIKNAGAGSSFDENAMWSALSGSSDNQINKSHLTNALAGYATESWVTGKGYATESWVASKNYATTEALNAVSNKLNDFLEGSDTDMIINKWKELEAFLSGMAETDNLAEILETKADKKYVDSTFVTLATKQTITGEKTFSSVLNTAAIKASGEITTPSLAASDYVTIAGIKLRKLEDGALMLEGNLALTGGLTTYASDGVSFASIYDGLPIDNDTIYWEEVEGSKVLKAKGGGEAGSVQWDNISGRPSVYATNIANITDLHSSWDSVLAAQKPNWLTAVSIATISDLHANWDALLKAAPSTFVTRWPTISEVTSKQNLVIKLNGGTTEGTNQFTYNATAAKTINITASSVGAAASSHNHSWSNITSGKPTTLAGYGITDAYTKAESDSKYPTKTGTGASGTWSINVTGNAGSATKLQTARTLWGRSFDGTKNISGDMTNVGWINNSLRINAKDNNDTTVIQWKGHTFIFGDSDWYTHVTYRFRPNYGSQGPTQSSVYIENASAATNGDPTYTTTHYFRQDGAAYHRVALGVGREATNYGIFTNTIYASDWFRSEGSTGWFNQTYGGGWYMLDTSWIRVYGNKSIYTEGMVEANSGFMAFAYYSDTNSASHKLDYNNCAFKNIVDAYVNHNSSRSILGWRDTVSGYGYSTRYVIGSERLYNSMWGRMYLAVGNNDSGTSIGCSIEIWGNGQATVNGNLLVTGGVTLYGSDIRYKSIMQQVNLSLMDIAKAPSFVYRWNKKGMKRDRLNLGGSAQYTQSVLPWAVEENDNFLSMDYATVAYTFAVHTARHLLTYESRTDKKIKKLENRVKYLEKQLKKLGYEEVRTLDDQSV